MSDFITKKIFIYNKNNNNFYYAKIHVFAFVIYIKKKTKRDIKEIF